MNFTPEEEKRLKEKYPFIIRKVDWYYGVEVPEDQWTLWITDIDDGWWEAFGMDLVEELNQILIKHNAMEEFTFVQIKEKFGALRIYAEYPERMREDWRLFIDKYELKSQVTCIHCGAPAKWISGGWICPWCEDCIDKALKDNNIEVDPHNTYNKYKGYIKINDFYDVTDKRLQDILDM